MYPAFYETGELALLLIIFLFIIISFFNTKFAAYAYLAIILVKPGELFPFLASIRFELLVAIYLVVLIAIKGKKFQLHYSFNKVNSALLVFFFLCILSIIQAFDVSHSYDYAYRVLFPIILLYATILAFFSDFEEIRIFIYFYLFIILYLSWLPIYNQLNQIGHLRIGAEIIHSKGETGLASGHVALANLLTQSLPFAYYLMIYEKRYYAKAFNLVCIIIFIFGTIGTGSRGGFLGIVISSLLFLIQSNKKVIFSIALLATVIILSPVLSDEYLNWINTILEFGSSDVSANSRWVGLRHGIEMAAKRPILGVGIGCYSLARGAWFGWSIWAHNHYGELIGELGLIGLFSWSLFIAYCFIEIRKMRNLLFTLPKPNDLVMAITNICWSVLVLRLIIGMTTHSLMSDVWYMVAAIIIITSTSLKRISEE